ncbi:MAG TPA: DUF4058 family protein [Gemmataceae bacterium]|nr:DUF4058 family protein [Gemmataceae bacterium]
MPNPFPGMDPYLEGDLWTTVHTDLCAEIARQLAPKLRPKYVALSTRRVVLSPPDENEGLSGQRFPDVGILSSHIPGTSSGAAVVSVPLILPTSFPEPIPHVSIEIRDVAERRLVTCIEVLSPTNKRGPGREEYMGKRFQILSGDAHLVEINLLRVGTRFPTGKPLPSVPYFVFISHAERRQEVGVWPIALEQPLPVVLIPLLADDPPVHLDLQQALAVVYDIIGYDELIDYALEPPGPLTPTESAWVAEQLRRAGRRKA